MAYVTTVGFPRTTLLPQAITSNSAVTLDATGESAAIIGEVYLEGGSASASKTISAAGSGKIYWTPGSSITFANGSSSFSVGIQDTSSGVEDGTFDVAAVLTGGGGGIAASAINKSTMTTGTKTLSHGQLIAVVMEFTARAGADSVSMRRYSTEPTSIFMFPYGTADTGSGPTKTRSIPPIMLEFDDGTMGWINLAPVWYPWVDDPSVISFNSGSTPDEYCAVISSAYPFKFNAAGLGLTNIDSIDAFELIYYTDPLGTPVAAQTLTPSVDEVGSAASTPTGPMLWRTFTEVTVPANTKIGIAARPTNTNSIEWAYYPNASGFEKLKKAMPFLTVEMAARTNQTGAFAVTQDYHIPLVGLWVSALDDGTSGGGGGQAVSIFG